MYLKIGDQGDEVRTMQLALAKMGYPLKGTGYFGPATDTAVESFQKRIGLPVDGIVDDRVMAAILTTSEAPRAPTMQAEMRRPLWLEVSLSHVGLREGPGAADNPELIADIRTIAEDYQHDATPWCAGWVSFCLAKAGCKPSSRPLWALSYADTSVEPIVRLPGPALGAIAVKKRKGGGHVTFVAGRTAGGALACCGGNQNDMVSIAPYAPSVFVGFFWPKGPTVPIDTSIKYLPIVSVRGTPLRSEA